MMTSMDLATTAPLLAILAVGLISVVVYGRKRKWIDVLLVGLAAVSLAIALSDIRLPATSASVLAITTDAAGGISESDLLAIPGASAIALSGDGLRAAAWRDLPARPLQWKPTDADLLWLDFPRSMSLGRLFTLTVRRSQAKAGWHLQLLAENKQVLADSNASGATTEATAQLSVQWLPPVAETMVLQARLLDAAGKTIAQGPIPLQVTDALPLQIQGRFDTPSFDARALNQLLADGSALLDWNVTLGKSISRTETPNAPITAPNAMFVDAAYVEHLSASARAALLAQAGQGVPLIILGGNATDVAMWQRDLGLRLHPQSPTTEKEDMRQFGAGLSMPPAALNPNDSAGESWSALARDSKKLPWLWQRDLQQGRVIWIGMADWHRYAISAPQALALWWQGAMDSIALPSAQKSGWRLPDPMPLPGLRSELCAQGVQPGGVLQVEGSAAVQLMVRSDKADALCGAIWPTKAGWMKFSTPGVTEQGIEYVYARTDWPTWQQALRRDATAQYAARAVGTVDIDPANLPAGRSLPLSPLLALFALCMLGLWWREQR